MAKQLTMDMLDYRDENTLWIWTNGYGVGEPLEVTRFQVEEMLSKGFDQT